MKIGVVGLGIIGGSFARVYSKTGHEVYVFDTDSSVMQFAILCQAAAGELTDDIIPQCDVIFICIYPEAALEYMEQKGALIGSRPVVIDCVGTKRNIVSRGMELAEKYGFTYVGGHPMAGTQYSGFKYSRDNMFVGAPMVIVPPCYDDPAFLDNIKKLLKPAGFGSISVTTAEKHDEIIAFTSQLAHVVSSAYIKSPTALKHKGFSAGSYKDMTRVAWLNPEMWTQLFLNNSDNLVFELDSIIKNLTEYRNAIEKGDRSALIRLLAEGKTIKELVDGK